MVAAVTRLVVRAVLLRLETISPRIAISMSVGRRRGTSSPQVAIICAVTGGVSPASIVITSRVRPSVMAPRMSLRPRRVRPCLLAAIFLLLADAEIGRAMRGREIATAMDGHFR